MELGDVGYISATGGFIKLFNVRHGVGSPYNASDEDSRRLRKGRRATSSSPCAISISFRPSR